MYLLARAQSLSGRPGDALVMLRRLAQLGVPTDAAENDDFRRVRALAGWAEVEALIASARDKRPAEDRTGARAGRFVEIKIRTCAAASIGVAGAGAENRQRARPSRRIRRPAAARRRCAWKNPRSIRWASPTTAPRAALSSATAT